MILNNDLTIKALLENTRCIAMVGASPKPWRDSYKVMAYLLEQGFEVLPINPSFAGQELLGRTVLADLAACPCPVDMVDIFRNSEAAGPIVDEAIAQSERLSLASIWMQLAVINQQAAERAVEAGLSVVMDRCPKIEIPRLGVAPKATSALTAAQ